MGEVHRLPDTDETEREAAAWFARMNADDVSAGDRASFEAWLRAHPSNAKTYGELCGTWQELVQSGPLVRAVYFGQAMNAASTAPVRSRRWASLAIAAGLAAVALAGTWKLYWRPEHTGFQTAIGEQASVALPDGSSLNLNTNSRVWIDFTQHSRVVRLERGEAFFKVAHDTQRPFWVSAGDSWVRAVGTAFNVYLRPSGVVVTVSEGTVNVVNAVSNEHPPSDAAESASAASVTEGEQVDVNGRAGVLHELNSAQLSRLLAWRRGSLYFQDQPLGEVVNELMRYTTLRIVVSDDALRRLPVGGTFSTSPEGAEALLTMLHDGFGATVRRDGHDRVYVEGPAG
ncbi:MAG TPA: FecR domain-containing protein [Steroidobacteraceae bacterium]|nr:FecR domain-containing protein [Steroidobacteraceae bacterium]